MGLSKESMKLRIPGISGEVRDIIGGGLVLGFSAFVFFASYSIRRTAVSRIGSDFFPRLISGILFIVGATVFIGGLIRHIRCKKGIATPEKDGCEENVFDSSIVLTPIFILGYFLVMEPLGFLIATTAYLFFQIRTLFSGRHLNPLILGAAAAVFSVTVYYLFRTAFHLYLPGGILAGLING